MRMIDLIEKKKHHLELTQDEINYIVNGYVNKTIPDYQMSAFLMAVYFNNMTDQETYYLTNAMLHSGEIIDLSKISGVKVDKHSTGGVGDKTSLVVGPLASSFGVKIAKMSGRGLGHTGGTLDKLESIPGFKIEISTNDFFNQVNKVGIAIIGQSLEVVPADKMLYALRDVTGTVDSIPLIASSIMSKKLASGADYIVLDVKVGSGAFMKNVEDATLLSETMVELGRKAGVPTIATLTNMQQPLGCAVGNAIEVIEAIDTLKGNGPRDFTELCISLTAEILTVAGIEEDFEKAKVLVQEAIHDGRGLKKLEEMIYAQGGNGNVVRDYSILPEASMAIDLTFTESGICYVEAIDALMIGEAAMLLGAGRITKEDPIDPAVGIYLHKKVGDKLTKGDIIATIYSNGIKTEEATQMVLGAYLLNESEVKTKPIIIKTIK